MTAPDRQPPPVIAIDGPAASGKGTIARALAARLGFAWLETGLLYRLVGLAALRQGLRADDGAGAEALARALACDPAAARLDDPELRSSAAADAASRFSALPGVRRALFDLQRRFAEAPPAGAGGAILDGRDIGTVICPEATAKLYVTADVETRAARRTAELQARGQQVIYPTVLADLQDRDMRDSLRADAPLAVARDAFVLDTSTLSVDQAADAALAYVRSRLGRASEAPP